MKLDIKGVIAILVVLGCFGLIAPYVIRNEEPNGLVLTFVSGALMLILGFYFGHLNGTQTALANSAVQLAGQANTILSAAMQRRVSDPLAVQVVPIPPPVRPVAPPPVPPQDPHQGGI